MVIYNFIFLLILIFNSFFEIFSHKKNGTFELFKKNEKYGIISLINKNKKFITSKNGEGESSTLAEIIIENSINYTPKISVIIPVNNEEYLSECLDSVIKQTIKEIEIICIYETSKDNILNILKKYAKKDTRITILKQENMNSGVARNAGLSVAKGKYLSFVYSKDILEFNMLEKMFEEIEKKESDIIICNYKTLNLIKGHMNEETFNNSIMLNLIPKINPFSVYEISKDIFQFIEGWAEDKLLGIKIRSINLSLSFKKIIQIF